MPKHAEGREKSERIVVPVTKDEHTYAKNAAGESGLAGKVREALREAGLLPPLEADRAAKAKKAGGK